MGKLIAGKWIEQSVITSDTSGSYDREDRGFRNTIDYDNDAFKPDSNRYHLYVSYACPWAHRTLIMRKLKKLEKHINVSVVHPGMLSQGWTFEKDFPCTTGDHLYDSELLYQIYQKADPNITTTVTVPVLWDKKHQTIVNNESSEIIRVFNSAFNELTGNKEDYYPEQFQSEIDEINEDVYHNINNGVYKTGFAKEQSIYEEEAHNLFRALDAIESRLQDRKYLVGDRITEADIRLIPTLLRFDCVYHGHFKCNLKRIIDFPNISRYLSELYSMEAIASTTHFDHIKYHYYFSHKEINPSGIVPIGPKVIF